MLAVRCMNCLQEIVERGMDDGRKAMLLTKLDVDIGLV
jgi:hypothetical protein